MPPIAFNQRRIVCFAAAFVTAIVSGIAGAGTVQDSDYEADFQKWRKDWLSSLRDDFGQLSYYRHENASLPPQKPGERRVVFFGDSITSGWDIARFFPGQSYLNRGISSQTTSQMLLRFRQDVIALKPAAAVILSGTNDLNWNTGPISVEDIESNYEAMAEAAQAHGIEVFFASLLPPPHKETAQSRFNLSRHPPEKVEALNAWLKRYCAAHGLGFVDYAGAMAGADGLIRPDLSEDGIHPNQAGYGVMAPLAQKAIMDALSRPGERQ